METSLIIDYDKQWLNCVSAIGPTGFIGLGLYIMIGSISFVLQWDIRGLWDIYLILTPFEVQLMTPPLGLTPYSYTR